ncbi:MULTISPECIES: hypothetical protein [Alistipes]
MQSLLGRVHHLQDKLLEQMRVIGCWTASRAS